MEYGSYSIRKEKNALFIDHRKTAKDWADMVIRLLIGFGLLTFVILMIIHANWKEWIFWVLGVICTVVAFYYIIQAIALLIQRSEGIVRLDKDKKRLISFDDPFNKTVIDFSDIGSVNLKGTCIHSYTRGGGVRSTIYATIFISLKNGKSSPILTINPDKIFSFSEKEVRQAEANTGQMLSKAIASEMEVPHTWTGFEKKSE